MRAREAKKLHNHDEVLVRTPEGEWEQGYILGQPKEVAGRIILPVQTPQNGWREVDHTDVK
jgi:hypothetical protein